LIGTGKIITRAVINVDRDDLLRSRAQSLLVRLQLEGAPATADGRDRCPTGLCRYAT
jgi:hypothetical protein